MTVQLDTAWVEAAKAGDPEALDAVVAEYLPLVYTIVRRALRRSADVDDVVQDTMLRVVRGVGSLRDPGRLRAWMVAVTVSQIREHYRSASVPSTSFDERADFPDPDGEFVERTLIHLDVSGQRRETQQAARWLDPEHRELLALWWLEASGHLTRAELVDALQADAHHVAVRVSRMKEQLDTARRVVRALTARPGCPALGAVGAAWQGETSSVWRKRFGRHVRECPVCGAAGHGLIPPERLLAGLALLPLPAAYAAFRATEAITWVGTVTLAGPGGGPDAAAPARVGDTGHSASAGGNAPDAADAGGAAGRHRAGAHRGGRGSGHGSGRGGGAKATTAFLGKPIGIAVAAVGLLAVAAAAVVELRPAHADQSLSVGPTATVLGPSAPATGVGPMISVSPGPSVSPSGPAGSAAPSPAPTSPTAASSAPAAPPQTRAAPATSASTAAGASGGGDSSYAAQQVLDVINQARAQAGLKPYTMSSDLIASAGAHNARMQDGCGLSHQCPGEPGLGDRETAAGVQWSSAGENIGDGGPVSDTRSAIAQMAVGLTNSMLAEKPPNDGHRLNILSSSFTEVGIVVSRDGSGTVWMTQDFAN